MSFSFTDSLRLKTAGYDLIMKKGVKTVTPFFVFLHIPSLTEFNQLGLVTAKRNLKTAVQRNRYRRIVRESFRLQQHQFAGFQVVVIARRAEKSPSNEELFTCLDTYWQKLITLSARS